MKLTVTNLHKAFRLNEAFVASVARAAARRLGLKKGEVALIFVDERRIRELNRAFKKKDCPTDVLGFEVSPPGRTGTFGDIFISLDAAKSNAASFGSYFEKEIILYMIHGLLHLAGYDDVRPKDRMRMRSKETELLDEICKTRNLSRVST